MTAKVYQQPKNPKNNNVENLCRVCSCRGTYDLFQLIPAYLHETEHEYMNWKLPISYYLHVVIDKPVKRNDGLPQKMCVLCISYLKHAYNFKMQALRNCALYKQDIKLPDETATLAVANWAESKKDPVRSISIAEDIDRIIKDNNLEELSDDNMEEESFAKSMFTYEQTNFEEDDVLDLAVFQSNQISFYLPETFKERKCSSCRRRFMFEESYNEHIRDCIQHKLVGFIREAIQLMKLKDNRSISSHEFIRRVIFSIKKSVTTLVEYDENVKKELGGDISQQSTAAKFDKSKPKPKAATVAPMGPFSTPITKISQIRVQDIFSNSPTESENITSNTSSPLCGIFMRCPQCNSTFEVRLLPHVLIRATTKLYYFQNLTDLETHNFKFHNRSFNTPQRYTVRRAKVSQPPHRPEDTESSPNEINNKYTKQPMRDFRNFNLASSNNAFKMMNTNIDIIKNNLGQREATVNSDSEQLKKVKCSKCPERFFTISHLDIHMAKKHTASPEPNKISNIQSTNSTPSKKRSGPLIR